MDISINAKVHCLDGDAGHVTCLAINPITNDITHLVLYDQQVLGVERLIPISLVTSSTDDEVTLNCRQKDLRRYEPFIGVDFNFLMQEPPYLNAESAYWPLVEPDGLDSYQTAYMMAQYEKVPPGELLVRRGAAVYAKDINIGHVHEFVADPDTGHISHLVLTRGHMWGKREILIPLSAIASYDKEQVTLKIDKDEVGELPEITLKR
jgi:hypothetical protein